MSDVYRPIILTCKWLREITESINNLCMDQPKIENCNNNSNLENLWNSYQDELKININRCPATQPTIRKILNCNVDYNNYRSVKS
jgi:hypothetical protein